MRVYAQDGSKRSELGLPGGCEDQSSVVVVYRERLQTYHESQPQKARLGQKMYGVSIDLTPQSLQRHNWALHTCVVES